MKKFLLILLTLFLFTSPVLAQTNPVVDIGCEAGEAAKLFSDVEACKSFADILNKAFSESPTSPWYAQSPQQFSLKVLDKSNPSEIFGERYTYAQINWIMNSLIAMLNPVAGANSPLEIIKFLVPLKDLFTYNPETPPMADYQRYGFLGIAGKILEYPYSHPIASGVNETKKIASLFNPITPVLAQGIGYAKLGTGNIRTLWTATRNISYLILIVLLIATGFMVMFRTQINAQTVVTVQMMIPRLAISLVLITFSYAIVGFVIDGIYVSIVAILGLLSATNPNFFMPGGFNTAITQLTGGNFNFVLNFLWMPIIISILLIVLMYLVGLLVGVAPDWGVTLIPNVVLPILGMMLALVGWSIYVAARIIGQLLFAYLNLIILTITGPLQIMMDLIPTQKDMGFKPWIKCVIGNASVFVVYIILAIVAKALFNFGGLSYAPGTNALNFGFNIATTQLREHFTLPGANINLNFSDIFSLIWWLFLGMAYFSAVPNIVAAVKDKLCGKEEDYSKVLESLAKDTVGQISKAGQGAAESFAKAELAKRAKPPPCLGKFTPISTPSGYVAVDKLKIGDVVWTFSKTGKKVSAKIILVNKTPVSKHKVLQITTENGKILMISPLHPLPSGLPINSIVPGQKISGVKILSVKLVKYTKKYVYDILPDGKTGYYETSGLILASTLKNN